ncbi:MAG: hypothetical protein A2V70_02605 [Planctomycetes bacterium RBG_13_63_9]|nr:MAG: hypothetical protein A2V70_02605 [Planctomycetes bacterium RBG_13_63_9]
MLIAQSTALAILAIVLLCAFPLLLCVVFLSFFSTWIKAFLSGVPVMLVDLIGMRLRQTDVKAVVHALTMAKHGGVTISCAEMEKAWAQHVDLEKVTLAMIRAQKDHLDVTFEELVDAELEDRLAEKLRERGKGHEEELAYR